MSRLTRDGTAEPVSRDQILRREQGQGKTYFPCSADHEQDWQRLILTRAMCDDHTYIDCMHRYKTHKYTLYAKVYALRTNSFSARQIFIKTKIELLGIELDYLYDYYKCTI